MKNEDGAMMTTARGWKFWNLPFTNFGGVSARCLEMLYYSKRAQVFVQKSCTVPILEVPGSPISKTCGA